MEIVEKIRKLQAERATLVAEANRLNRQVHELSADPSADVSQLVVSRRAAQQKADEYNGRLRSAWDELESRLIESGVATREQLDDLTGEEMVELISE